MKPLTPVRRGRFPVVLPGGQVEPSAGIWRLPRARRGEPGALMVHRPGGWRSAVALVRLLAAVRP